MIELAGALHPTPAVGGEPSEVAQRLIPALEGLDRGWYAGDGRLERRRPATVSSAWRCAARCCAVRMRPAMPAAAIVRDSDPAAELAETEVKLQALLPLLAG